MKLRAYPRDLLADPASTTTARVGLVPGEGEEVPHSSARAARGERWRRVRVPRRPGADSGLILLSLVLALFWGAAHALTPGHGKAIVAAYLVGSRGRPAMRSRWAGS